MDQSPNIFINPEVNTAIVAKRIFNPKYLFIILGVIVTIGIVIGVKALIQRSSSISAPANQNTSTSQVAILDSNAVINAKLFFETTKTEFRVGEEVPVTVKIDTDGQIADGVDVVLKFDPKILEASSASIITGTLFPDYPVSKVQDGIVRITAITSLAGKGYSGSGIFAVINFKAKAKGMAFVRFEFTKGSTTDTNIVGSEFTNDMLGEVKDLEVVIK